MEQIEESESIVSQFVGTRPETIARLTLMFKDGIVSVWNNRAVDRNNLMYTYTEGLWAGALADPENLVEVRRFTKTGTLDSIIEHLKSDTTDARALLFAATLKSINE